MRLYIPGDRDSTIARTLQQAETKALNMASPPLHAEMADRIVRYAAQAQRMRRGGSIAW